MKRTGRFYAFLRIVRARLFDETFQAQLVATYAAPHGGTEPVPPACVTAVLLLQAFAKVSDAEAIRRVHMDLAWQMVLGWLGTDPESIRLSQGTLFNVRERLIATGMDKVLLARTVQLARETGLFGARALAGIRLVIDSAPLDGAGRVEDTINLLGHALRHVAAAAAHLLDEDVAAIAVAAGLPVLGGSSIKAALDLDWNAPTAVQTGLDALLAQRANLDAWLAQQGEGVRLHSSVLEAQAVLARVVEQDTEGDPTRRGRRLKEGVAADRLISLHDPEMRHGRKSKSQRIDGYKRFVGGDVDAALVLGVAVQPANVGEHHGADTLRPEVEQHGPIVEVQVDRAFLASQLVVDLDARGDTVLAKAYPDQGTPGFTKHDFTIDEAAGTVTCPAGQTTPLRDDRIAKFPNATCAACAHRPSCQKAGAKAGRSIQVHPREALLKKLRAGTETDVGRARLRERVVVEHQLAHVVFRQGDRARYVGVRKNEYDLRRSSAVQNLHALDRHGVLEDEVYAEAA